MQIRALTAQVFALIAEISNCGCQFRNFPCTGSATSAEAGWDRAEDLHPQSPTTSVSARENQPHWRLCYGRGWFR